MSADHGGTLFERVYVLLRQIPPGFVTTYGELGRSLGCSARTVGFALAALPAGHDLPWQRVINSRGRVSPRADGDGGEVQRLLLEAEGVCFDEAGRVDLERYRWRLATDQ